MNGVSHMIPVVVAGGVITALSLLSQQLGLPASWTMMMKNVGSAAFVMMYPVLAAFIASSIGTAPPLCPACWAAIWHRWARPRSPTSAGSQAASGGTDRRLCRRFDRAAAEPSARPDTAGAEPHKDRAARPHMQSFIHRLADAYDRQSAAGPLQPVDVALPVKMQGGSRLLLSALLGGMMATDYGGPINKAAYVSGTLALVDLQYDLMAAVMAGGMVPPLGLALACMLFPTRFTASERRSVPQTAIMGLSFVTEGALPFSLRDPLRVGPSCIAGSALAGFLAIFLGCGCPAPMADCFCCP